MQDYTAQGHFHSHRFVNDGLYRCLPQKLGHQSGNSNINNKNNNNKNR